MHRILRPSSGALAALLFLGGCSASKGLPPATLAAADPGAAEAPFAPPTNSLAADRPRTLALDAPPPPMQMDHGAHGGSSGTDGTKESAPPGHEGMQHGEAKPAKEAKDATVYTCPMHPEIREKAPGKCPKCGMTLVPAKDGEKGEEKMKPSASPKASPSASPTPSGHEGHQGHGGTP